jgi:hypothetical protein
MERLDFETARGDQPPDASDETTLATIPSHTIVGETTTARLEYPILYHYNAGGKAISVELSLWQVRLVMPEWYKQYREQHGEVYLRSSSADAPTVIELQSH